MSSDPDEFDPTRVLDGWCATQEDGLPELDLNGVVGLARRAALDPGQMARIQRLGFNMQDIEDLEPKRILSPMPEASPHQPSPRLLERWQAGCWSAAARRVLIGRNEGPAGTDGPTAQSHEPHWLLAIWPPQSDGERPNVSHWPEHVVLVPARDSLMAADQLLDWLPADALLWLGQFYVDWPLAAEVLLRHEPALSPFLAQVLRDFTALERMAQAQRIHKAYEPAAPGRMLRRKRP
ncbi:MAG TPA: hypothetical protein VGM81_25220 [Burkholderiaceae bacterium]|jgi:hypothetical protein